MKLFKNNRNLFIIALVAVVNALGYGIVIPVLYSYSQKYGLSDFQNGLLFAIFSICQFLSTPFIGRMSDKYGRRPLLIVSISGTVVSFVMMAFAPSAIFLFLARALDGLTAGNIPVASAVISDTTTMEDRAKGFGIIGASFGFGFVFGPAISALTVGYSPSLPFIIAALVSLVAVVMTAIFLPETNKHIGQVKQGKLFDLGKLYHALFDPNVGATLLITLFYFLGVFSFIYAFQPYSVKVLLLSAHGIALLFTMFGFLGLITQTILVHRFTKHFGLKKTFAGAIVVSMVAYIVMILFQTLPMFVVSLILLAIPNAMVQTLINTILSGETDAKSQGSILGISASYMSIGQIVGPIAGGALATVSIPFPFLGSALCSLVCFFLTFHVLKPGVRKESAF